MFQKEIGGISLGAFKGKRNKFNLEQIKSLRKLDLLGS
jgi:hypothetical protein